MLCGAGVAGGVECSEEMGWREGQGREEKK